MTRSNRERSGDADSENNERRPTHCILRLPPLEPFWRSTLAVRKLEAVLLTYLPAQSREHLLIGKDPASKTGVLSLERDAHMQRVIHHLPEPSRTTSQGWR